MRHIFNHLEVEWT